MLISHRYRFIYTKTAKTAGTSVESFFERFCMSEGEWTQSHARDEYESPSGVIGYRGAKPPDGTKWYNHMSALSIKELVGQDIWDSYFKFCVIRNPFDKCISGFCHLGKDHQLGHSSISINLQDQDMNLEQLRFFDYLQKSAPVDRDKYMIDGKFCLDDVIRYENLEADIKRICQHIGVPFDNKYLPTFKKGLRGEDATIESLFTEKSREVVEKEFAFELQHFGYRYTNHKA